MTIYLCHSQVIGVLDDQGVAKLLLQLRQQKNNPMQPVTPPTATTTESNIGRTGDNIPAARRCLMPKPPMPTMSLVSTDGAAKTPISTHEPVSAGANDDDDTFMVRITVF